MAAGLGVTLLAGALLAIVDVVHTGGGALAVLATWAVVTLPMAIGLGAVLAAGNAMWGVGWVRGFFKKLSEDRELDHKVAAIAISCALLGGVLVLVIAKASLGLVGDVQRKAIGALLLGAVVVATVPVFALAAIPMYKLIRLGAAVKDVVFFGVALAVIAVAILLFGRFAGFALFVLAVAIKLPAIGPIPRVVMLAAGGIGAAVLGGAFIIYTQLDYQALNLMSLILPAMLPVIALAIGIVAYTVGAGLRESIPARGAIALVAAIGAAGIAFAGLREPSVETREAVTERSYLGARLVPVLRKLRDKDGDGYSAFFGGPDCDDGDPEVHPGATEIAENGKDDNCLGGDGKKEAPPPPPTGDAGVPAVSTVSGGKNVLIIFVDTLRYDRLGVAGYKRDGKSLTPRLDAFAAQSVVFDKAFAQAPNTPRSVPSFLGSRYPTQLDIDRGKKTNYPTILDGNELLFEVLKPAGFRTIGETSHFYFCDRVKQPDSCGDVVSWMKSNIQQGADEWDNSGALNIPESNRDVAGPRIVKKTTAKLRDLAKAPPDTGKFAMLVHLFEPHSTYVEHEGYPITERGTDSLAQKYDYEIAVVDKRIGEILDVLEETKLAATTTVIVMSDHGEAFGVHRVAGQQMFFHGQTLYRELIHVPLMFRVPGVKPRTASDVVMLLDLAPTVAALFAVPAPASWQGRSLVPAFEGKALDPKPAFAELVPVPDWDHESRSMITADGKKHVLFDLSKWEIFDLGADPDEKDNLAGKDPDAETLKGQVTTFIERPRDK